LILKESVFVVNILKPLSPLGSDLPMSTMRVGPVTIVENTQSAYASLAMRLGQHAVFDAAAVACQIPLPGPGQAIFGPVYSAFWLGPDQWMIEAPYDKFEDITAHIKPLFGEAASVTEQTDAWVRFDVMADDLPLMFERLCNYDLRAVSAGSATRCVIEHLGCYIILRALGAPSGSVSGSASLSVLGPRSSARSLHHALITAAKSAF
jgi:sarcosine oxidase subunit gamma